MPTFLTSNVGRWGLNSDLCICSASVLPMERRPLLLDFKLHKGSVLGIFTRSSGSPQAFHSSSTAQARPSLGSSRHWLGSPRAWLSSGHLPDFKKDHGLTGPVSSPETWAYKHLLLRMGSQWASVREKPTKTKSGTQQNIQEQPQSLLPSNSLSEAVLRDPRPTELQVHDVPAHSGILDSFCIKLFSCLWGRTPGTKPPHLGCSTSLPGLLRKDFKIQTIYKVKEDTRPSPSPLGPGKSGDRTWPL